MVLRQGCVAPAKQVPLMQVLDWLRDQFSEEWCQVLRDDLFFGELEANQFGGSRRRPTK